MTDLLNSYYRRTLGSEVTQEAEASFTVNRGSLCIGTLRLKDSEWSFAYDAGFAADSRGLLPLLPFPDTGVTYRSASLWPFFLSRVPSLKQQDVRKELKLDSPDAVRSELAELLERYGKRSVNNSLILSRAK